MDTLNFQQKKQVKSRRFPLVILIVLQILLVVFVISAVLLNSHYLKKSALSHAEEQTQAQAYNLENRLNQDFELIYTHLNKLFTEHPVIYESSEVIQKELLNLLHALPYVRSLSLINSQQTVFSSTHPGNLGKQINTTLFLPEIDEYASDVLRFGNAWVGRDFNEGLPIEQASAEDKNSHFSFFPVSFHLPFTPDWQVVAAISGEYFINIITQNAHTKKINHSVWSDNSTLLFSTNSHLQIGATYPNPDYFQVMLQKHIGSNINQETPFGTAVMSYRVSQNYPFLVQTTFFHNTLLGKWREDTFFLWRLTGSLLIIVLFFTGYLTWRTWSAMRKEQNYIDKINTLSQVVIQSPSSIMITDHEATIKYVNPAFSRITGYSEEEVVGQNPRIFQSGLTPNNVYQSLWQHLKSGKTWDGRFVNKCKDGSLLYETAIITRLENGSDQDISYMAIKNDVTAYKETEKAMRLASKTIEATHEGIIVTDSEKTIIDVNPAFSIITGYSKEEALGMHLFDVLNSQKMDEFQELPDALAKNDHWHGILWISSKVGTEVAILNTTTKLEDPEDQSSHYISLFSNITELKLQEKMLEQQAYYDLLTGLPNRLSLMMQLHKELATSKRHNNLMAVCFIDLDGFKAVNDTYGHDAGDELLIEIAQRLQYTIRVEDTAARLGGDEFVVVLNYLKDLDEGKHIASRLLEVINKGILVADCQEVFVSGSIGITLYPLAHNKYLGPEDVLKQADTAMYAAKETGRNCYVVFEGGS